MRVLVLACDARPEAAGSLPAEVTALTSALARRGDEVHVLATGDDAPTHAERRRSVTVHWVGEAPPVIPGDDGHIGRVLALNTRAFTAATRLADESPLDVVIAWGWEMTYAAANLRDTHQLALLAVLDGPTTVDADALTGDALLIHQIEWWLTYEARRVAAPSHDAALALRTAFQLPQEKLDVIPLPPRRPRRGTTTPRRWSDVADAYAAALARTIREEHELRGDSARPPLRPVLLRSLTIDDTTAGS